MDPDIEQRLRQALADHQAGRLSKALAGYAEILEIEPRQPDAHHLMGVVAYQQSDPQTARRRIEHAISLDPTQGMYHGNLGRACKELGDWRAAEQAFRQALERLPTDAPLRADLSGVLLEQGKVEAAREAATLALNHAPNLPEAKHNLALAHQALGEQLQDKDKWAAETQYKAALELVPSLLVARTNLGNLYRERADFGLAVEAYQAALTQDPKNALILGNLGVTLQEQGDVQGALEAYDQALESQPNQAEIQRNRAMALLALKQWSEGWSAFESRFHTVRYQTIALPKTPRWAGGALKGQHLLVVHEQGLGDTIQFCRFIKALPEAAGVTVAVPHSLVSLLAESTIGDRVVALEEGWSAHDLHVPMMSLPHAVGVGGALEASPYLTASHERIDRFQNFLKGRPRPLIGLAWKGSAAHPRDALRSPGLTAFTPLFRKDRPGTIVSLQLDGAEDLRATAGAGEFVDPTPQIRDFADTAGLIQGLDHVIACDSAVAHLSGALGQQTSLLLPHVPEWRWEQEGDSTRWYPTVTLVRQTRLDHWEGTLEKLEPLFNSRI